MKLKIITIAIVVTAVTATFFCMFGFYSVDNGGKTQRVFVRKIANENMSMNLLKSRIDKVVQRGDMVVFKNTDFADPDFADKKNLCSRVVALPGDIVRIVDAKVIVNDNPVDSNTDLWLTYRISMSERTDFQAVMGSYDVDILRVINSDKACDFVAKKSTAKRIQDEIQPLNLRQLIENKGDTQIFPVGSSLWNKDNFGPVVVPQSDLTVALNPRNINLYSRIIDLYEEHDFSLSGDKIIIDGHDANEYVIEKNYYFVVNDNRHNLNDSRHFGFIPADYIIGKAVAQ